MTAKQHCAHLLARGLLPLGLAAFFPAFAQAPSSTDPPLRLYAASSGLEAARYARFAHGDYGDPAGFSAKARIAFKMEPQSLLGSMRAFGLGEQARLHVLRGTPGAADAQLTIHAAPVDAATPVHARDFDSVWVDFRTLEGTVPCEAHVTVKAAAGAERIDATTWPRPVATFEATGEWKEKGVMYVASRLAHVAPDAAWRFAASGENIVVQRRMHVRLAEGHELQVAVAPGTAVKQVNLLLADSDDHSPGEVAEFPAPPVQALPDGRAGVRIALAEAVAKAFPGRTLRGMADDKAHGVYLQEIVVFVPGGGDPSARARVVQGAALLGNPSAGGRTLARRVIGLSPARRRMIADLAPVAALDATLREIDVTLMQPPGAPTCAVQLDGVYAASSYQGAVPSFAARVNALSAQWGGYFTLPLPRYDEIDDVGLIAYLPIGALTARQGPPDPRTQRAKSEVDGRKEGSREPEPGAPKDRQFRTYHVLAADGRERFQDPSRLVANGGAVLQDGGTPKTTVEGDMMVMETQGAPVRISWPLDVEVDERTRFRVGIAEGVQNIGGMLLDIDMASGESTDREVLAEHSLQLGVGRARIRRLTLTLLPAAAPFKVKLRDMALFSPRTASYAEALRIALPRHELLRPRPQLPSAAGVLVGDGQLGAAQAAGDARGPIAFATRLDPALEWVAGLRLDYRFPSARAHRDPCRVKLRFEWTRGTTESRLCFESAQGSLVVPMADFLPEDAALGALKSVDWQVTGFTGTRRDAPESFELRFAFDGWRRVSALDELRLAPLVTANGEGLFADPAALAALPERKFTAAAWLDLQADAPARLSRGGGRIAASDGALASTSEVVAVPPAPLPWEQPAAPPARPAPNYAAFGWLAALALAVLAWRPAARVAASAGAAMHRRTAPMRARVRAAWPEHSTLARYAPAFHAGVGLVAAGPGVWLAGRLGFDYRGLMVLLTALLLAASAWWHWRQARTGGEPLAGGVAYARVAWAIAVACAVWSLGRHGLAAEAAWGFAPLVGAIYSLSWAPALIRVASAAWDFVPAAAWLALSLLLFSRGTPLAAGRELVLVFAALAATAGLRSLLLALRAPFTSRFPRAGATLYGVPGGIYITAALVVVAAAAALLACKAIYAAEQLAIIAFFCMAAGVAREVTARR